MKFTGFVTHSGRSSLVQKGCACYIYVLYLRESGIPVTIEIQNPSFTDNESWIQNQRLSWINLITWLESYVWTNMFPRNSRHIILPVFLKPGSFWAFIYTTKSGHVDLQLTCSCWMISRGSSKLAVGRPSVVAPLKLSVRIMLISAQTSFKVTSAWRCK